MREEIIKMAREAGALQIGFNKTIMQSEYSIFAHELERFFNMAQAAEREACAKEVDFILRPGGGTMGDTIRARGQK